MMRVAVIGASNKPHRISYQAVSSLLQAGHDVYPVHPVLKEIQGLPVYNGIEKVPEPVHTVTVYVNAERSTPMAEAIVNLHPKRVIFNPGAENVVLAKTLQGHGINVVEACTLVLLHTKQF